MRTKSPFLYSFFKPIQNTKESYLKEFDNSVKKIFSKYPGITYINLIELLPNPVTIDGVPLYKDWNHLNVFGAKYLAEQFIKSGQRLIKPEDLQSTQ